MDDRDLLHAFVAGSNPAFTELAGRHLPLVFHAALRRTGDVHRAADVAQQVFILLAHKAGRLASHAALAGWLYTTTQHVALRALRGDARRRVREEAALIVNTPEADTSATADWDRLRPVLDDALLELKNSDRDAVVLRYLEARPWSEVGRGLRIGEEAARKRVARAVARLRAILERRGIHSTEGALAAVFAASAAAAVPPDVVTRISATAWQDARAGATAALGVRAITLTKAVIGAFMAFATAAGLWLASRPQGLPTPERVAGNARLEVPNWSAQESVAPSSAERIRSVTAATDETLIRLDALSDKGRQTPAAALATFVWASAEGSADEIARVTCLTGVAQAKAAQLFATLPEAVQAGYGSPEGMMSVFVAHWATGLFQGRGTLRIRSVVPSGEGEVVIGVELLAPAVIVEKGWPQWKFARGREGWQAVIPLEMVDRAVVRLREGGRG